jgi:Cof subfamily protein (haloacid dehalogenase superfamily)
LTHSLSPLPESTAPYRLCAIDLDDTLLNSAHRISDHNRDTIAAARAQGVLIVLASGRMFETTTPFARQLDLDTPIICYNGAMVRNPSTRETWLHEQVQADLADTIRAYACSHRLQLNYYLDDHLYTEADTSWMQLYRSRTGAPTEVLPDFCWVLSGTTPTKLIIVDSPQTTDALLPEFRHQFGDRLYITKSNNEYLEFLPPTADKGRALALVAERFGIAQSETIAIGDSWNDTPMVRWAGLGLAVANAKPELKAVADRVIGSNDDDGVAGALSEIFHLSV